MNTNDIKLKTDKDFSVGFGGGAMILECKKCKRDIAHKEIDFPGTKEQQIPIIAYFEDVKKKHICYEIEKIGLIIK